MTTDLVRHARRLAGSAAAACLVCVSLVGVGATAGAATKPLSISISGNHFVNGSGHIVRLLGVNRTSSEYGCVDGFGYDDGHFTAADAAAIASWGADAVRVPLNEDCWLGINGQPNSNEGADPALTPSGYRREITNYVADLNHHGIYAILDLHWTAPGAQVALEQQPMPDFDHSPAFWGSVASTFKTNHAVVFDLFNEPYDPTDPRSGTDQNPNDKVTWTCWQTGTRSGPVGDASCFTSAYDENNNPTSRYRVAGMQTLLNAVRAAGATQPVLAGGLNFANDLGEHDHGRAWLAHAPHDARHQVAASFHNYSGQSCDTTACWKGSIAPIATRVPVVTGEFDEDNYDEATCGNRKPSTFDSRYMAWADSAGVSYLAWGWVVESKAEQGADGCSDYVLITSYTTYAPASPNGVVLRTHLRALAAAAKVKPPVTLTAFASKINAEATRVGYTLRTGQSAHGTLTAATLHTYPATKGKRHTVKVGALRLNLSARRSKVFAMTMSAASRTLLAASHSLEVRVTITLSSPQHRMTAFHRTITLRSPKR